MLAAIRILIADDHPVWRRGIRALLDAEDDLTVVMEASDGEEALKWIRSGNVDVADVSGDRVVIDTGSGNVRARSLRGDVLIDTGSGNVEVDRVDGELVVDTGSGRVAVGLVDGPVAIDTGSGRVDLAIAASAPVVVDTGSGGITVTVPRGAGFDLDADGSSVRLDEALGFRGSRERDEADGRIGGGGPDLRLSAGSGAVEVRAD